MGQPTLAATLALLMAASATAAAAPMTLAIIAPSDGDTLIAFPLVNGVWTFGRPR